MRFGSLIGVALLGLAIPATVVAQDAAPALPEEAAAPQPGEPYVVAQYQDWEILCTRFVDDGEEQCEMYQLLIGEDETPLAEVSIAMLPEDEEFSVGATVTAPLGTFLLTGMAWQIGDDGDLREEPFQVCNRIGCIALLGLQDEEVDQMRRGSHAFVLFRPFAATDQVVGARVSLMGFTAAMADLQERNPPTPTMSPDAGDGGAAE